MFRRNTGINKNLGVSAATPPEGRVGFAGPQVCENLGLDAFAKLDYLDAFAKLDYLDAFAKLDYKVKNQYRVANIVLIY